MFSSTSEILKRNQLSVTESRKKILDMFLRTDGALAHADIEQRSGTGFDRVTVYRTLQTFVEKGIIHTTPTNPVAPVTRIMLSVCTKIRPGTFRQDYILNIYR